MLSHGIKREEHNLGGGAAARQSPLYQLMSQQLRRAQGSVEEVGNRDRAAPTHPPAATRQRRVASLAISPQSPSSSLPPPPPPPSSPPPTPSRPQLLQASSSVAELSELLAPIPSARAAAALRLARLEALRLGEVTSRVCPCPCPCPCPWHVHVTAV